MTTVPWITRKRNQKGKPRGITFRSGAGWGCSLLVSFILIFSGVAISIFFIFLTRDLPSLELFPLYIESPDGMILNPTVLFDRTGEIELLKLQDPAAAAAEYLRLKSGLDQPEGKYFSPDLVKAVIVHFEPDYWESETSPILSLLDGEENIIAQNLVSEIALWDEPQGTLRVLRTRLLASQIITNFGREKVLEWYLNSAKFGDLVYGADAASHVYFGKSASQLSLGESALLAAIAGAPDINPHTVAELSLERQKGLIKKMVMLGVITLNESISAAEEKMIFSEEKPHVNEFIPFTSYVIDQVSQILPRERLDRGGIRIITTMDYDLQVQSLCAIMALAARSGGQNGEITTTGEETCEAERLLPTGIKPGEENLLELNAAVAISDPGTGELLAFVTGPDKGGSVKDISAYTSGTVLSPYVFLTAFSRGLNPGTLIWDIPEEPDQTDISAPESDFDDLISLLEPYRGPLRLRTALANDYLRPAVRLLEQVGSENVLRTLSRFGVNTADPSFSTKDINEYIFEEDISLIEAIRAYGILANKGILAGQHVEKHPQGESQEVLQLSSLIRLEDASGSMLLDWSVPQTRSIVSPQLAYLMTHVLSDEPARWDSLGHPNPLEIGRPAAVKLSHTLDNRSAWVIGYVPDRAVGVWVEVPVNTSEPFSAPLSSVLWHALMQYALQGEPVSEWDIPPGVERVDVCDPSGLLPSVYCPLVVTEVFLSGQEPVHSDTLFRSYQVNRETGNLATVFTPPELIDEQIFMDVPPHAEEWARSQNLPVPPDSYDPVSASTNNRDGFQIALPEMFSHVSGVVSIVGSADGTGFSYYRLQAGQGLNPDEWIQIGEDISEPVHEDILALWDTKGLSGLYAVQLLVVYEDQRVDKFILQVTVDNQEPRVEILSPVQGQNISMQKDETVILRADATDDTELREVEFYLDDRPLGTVQDSPFILPWKSTSGEHTLLVQAIDLAGNINQDYIEFKVIR